MNFQSPLAVELRDKEYRAAFVGSQIRIGLPFQIRQLRKSRNMTQPELAKAAEMSQPRISEIETPGARSLTLDTLRRIAAAFDVALQVSFVPFSKLVEDDERLDLENFEVPSFESEFAASEKGGRVQRNSSILLAFDGGEQPSDSSNEQRSNEAVLAFDGGAQPSDSRNMQRSNEVVLAFDGGPQPSHSSCVGRALEISANQSKGEHSKRGPYGYQSRIAG